MTTNHIGQKPSTHQPEAPHTPSRNLPDSSKRDKPRRPEALHTAARNPPLSSNGVPMTANHISQKPSTQQPETLPTAATTTNHVGQNLHTAARNPPLSSKGSSPSRQSTSARSHPRRSKSPAPIKVCQPGCLACWFFF